MDRPDILVNKAGVMSDFPTRSALEVHLGDLQTLSLLNMFSAWARIHALPPRRQPPHATMRNARGPGLLTFGNAKPVSVSAW